MSEIIKNNDIDITDMDYDNDSFLEKEDDNSFDLNNNITLIPSTPNIVNNTSQNNPSISTDPNSFIVLNVLDSDKKLPELIKQSNNLKPNQDDSDTEHNDESSTTDLAMPRLEYTKLPDLESDFQLARRNLIALTKQGTSVVEDIVALAKSTEHPNTYKALNETLSTFAQLNKDLIEIYKTKIEIEKKVAESGDVSNISTTNGSSNVQNNVFIGTTDELLSKIANAGLNNLDSLLVPVQEEKEEK